MPSLDQPADVRDPLDEAALTDFLADRLDLTGPLTVRQFPGGFSNLTYLVTVGEASPEEGTSRELVLRLPPPAADARKDGGTVRSRHWPLR